jgi:hypothetical protein
VTSRAAIPGTSSAWPQVPPTWLTTGAGSPPALQLPAEAHDTDLILALPPALSAAVPGTSFAFPQVPPEAARQVKVLALAGGLA